MKYLFHFLKNYIILFFYLGLNLQHNDTPRLVFELELQPLAYATATATLNPLSEARDQTCILTDTSRVCNLLSYHENSGKGVY